MRYEVHPPLGHPEVAGWVLGALDRAEADAFGRHVWSCAQCQVATAEFEAVAKALDRPVPADEPPAGLEARVLAAIQHAAMIPVRPAEAAPRLEEVPRQGGAGPRLEAVPQPDGAGPRLEEVPQPDGAGPRLEEVPRPGGAGRRPQARETKVQWRWLRNNRLLTAAAAAVVTVAAFLGFEVFHGAAPAVAATIPLHAAPVGSGSGLATARQAQGGWSIRLTVDHLKVLGAGDFYECWYAGQASPAGHPQLIPAGSFTVDRNGGGTFTMWSAADPHKLKTMEITEGGPGDASQPGPVVLLGTARSG
jgi:hypothetical protein